MVVEIEGKRFDLESADWQNLDCIRIDADTFHLLENGLAHTISIIASDPSSRKYTLKIDGEIKEVTLMDNLDLLIEKMGLNSTKTKKLSVLKAPMPGMVTCAFSSVILSLDKVKRYGAISSVTNPLLTLYCTIIVPPSLTQSNNILFL